MREIIHTKTMLVTKLKENEKKTFKIRDVVEQPAGEAFEDNASDP